jgi:hypothetical protein
MHQSPDTFGHVPEPPAAPSPQVVIDLMLAEMEIMRAQLGLGPALALEQPMLRDISPFGR